MDSEIDDLIRNICLQTQENIFKNTLSKIKLSSEKWDLCDVDNLENQVLVAKNIIEFFEKI